MAKILVVEDEPNNLELALRIVRHAGHEATVATDGFAALELAREHRPQLILLDLQLPKLDGWTVVKLLRKETWAKNVPIVAVSASALTGRRAQGHRSGVHSLSLQALLPSRPAGDAQPVPTGRLKKARAERFTREDRDHQS